MRVDTPDYFTALKKAMLETQEVMTANILNKAFPVRWDSEWLAEYKRARRKAKAERNKT